MASAARMERADQRVRRKDDRAPAHWDRSTMPSRLCKPSGGTRRKEQHPRERAIPGHTVSSSTIRFALSAVSLFISSDSK